MIYYMVYYLLCEILIVYRMKIFTTVKPKGSSSLILSPLFNYRLVDKCRSVTQFSKYHMRPRKNEFECHVLVKAFVHSNEHLNLKNIQNDVFKIVLFRQKLTLF